jgi:hypothetical protein
LDCWHEHFPVEDLLKRELTPQQWESAFNRGSKTKLMSLVELIEQAKKRKKKNHEEG